MNEQELRNKIAEELEDIFLAFSKSKDNKTEYEQGIEQGYAKAIQVIKGI